jgi:glucose uptake protein GlcU
VSENSEKSIEELEHESEENQRYCTFIVVLIVPTLAYLGINMAQSGGESATLQALILLIVAVFILVGALIYIIDQRYFNWKRRKAMEPKWRSPPRPRERPKDRPGLELQ